MSRAALRLSAAGSGALAVFQLARAELPEELHLLDASGRVRAWPAARQWTLAQLMLGKQRLDEVVVLGRHELIELHTHGANQVVANLEAALRVCPAESTHDELDSAARCLRGVRALASAECGVLAALLASLRTGAGDRRCLPGLARANQLLAFGAALAEPPQVRLVGHPNAGKSTLFNRLCGESRALVSEHAGTTRDTVTHEILISGVPVRLEDAAGAQIPVPPHGGADLLIHLLRSEAEDPIQGATTLRVLGRADERAAGSGPRVSGATGAGVPELLDRVAAELGLNRSSDDDLWTPVRSSDRAVVAAAAGQ